MPAKICFAQLNDVTSRDIGIILGFNSLHSLRGYVLFTCKSLTINVSAMSWWCSSLKAYKKNNSDNSGGYLVTINIYIVLTLTVLVSIFENGWSCFREVHPHSFSRATFENFSVKVLCQLGLNKSLHKTIRVCYCYRNTQY